MNWLRHLAQRWGARHLPLVCPQCQQPASLLAFKRGRFKLGDESLVCERCGETSVVTFWRFEGLAGHDDRTAAAQTRGWHTHRAAITHHRKRRAQAMTRSVLDEVPGLGPAKQSALLRQFGSVAAMRELSVEQLTQAKGVGPALAQAIKDHLDAHPAGGAKKNSHK